MSEYDGTDYYKVDLKAGAYKVRHYSGDGGRPCCRATVTITDADRAQACDGEVVRGSLAALLRCYRGLEQKHGRA